MRANLDDGKNGVPDGWVLSKQGKKAEGEVGCEPAALLHQVAGTDERLKEVRGLAVDMTHRATCMAPTVDSPNLYIGRSHNTMWYYAVLCEPTYVPNICMSSMYVGVYKSYSVVSRPARIMRSSALGYPKA